MSIALYTAHHVPRAITSGLRLRNVDVLTAQEDGASEFEDHALLDRATSLGRVLFSQDDDLLAEATHRQKEIFPSSYECDCGHQSLFCENTIREAKAMSFCYRRISNSCFSSLCPDVDRI